MKNTSCYTALILVFHCFVFTNLDKLEAYPDKALLLKQIRKKELMDAQLLKQSAQLLQELKKRDEKAGVRNGDLGKALIAYRSCKYLIETRSEKKKGPTRIDLKEKQNLSEPDFQSAILDLKAQMIKVLETEKIIERQKIHFPELFQKISELKNTNGRPLWIYIFSHVQLPKLAGEASGFNALTVMARAEGRFTSDTPSLRKLFPDLKKCNNGISVHIVVNHPW